MSMKKTVILSEPLETGGKQITEVEVRRANIGDEEDAMQMAIQFKKGKNPLTVEMCLMSRLTKLPYDVVRSMHTQDYVTIRQAMNELNGSEAEEPDNENPMTP